MFHQHTQSSTHHNHTSPVLHTSIAVTLAPSHYLTIVRCNTNNSTSITVTATTASILGTEPTSQTDQGLPQYYQIPHKHTDPVVNVSEFYYSSGQHKLNLKHTRCTHTAYSQHTCSMSSQFRKPRSPLNRKLTKYITSPPYALIGCPRQEVGSSHSS